MPVDSKVGRRHWGWLVLLVKFWKFQHFNLVSKIFQKLFKPLPCHKSIEKMLHAICISAVAVSLRWASCGPWASCFFYYFSQKTGFDISCKLSDLETVCMIYQNLFSRKNIWICRLQKILPRVLSFKNRLVFFSDWLHLKFFWTWVTSDPSSLDYDNLASCTIRHTCSLSWH